MSEAEKKKRLAYKLKRKKRILWQVIALVIVLALCFSMAMLYQRLDRTYYINYTENGSADYSVKLLENEFFEEDALGSQRGYVTALVEHITADFSYSLYADAEAVKYDYRYYIDAKVQIANKTTGSVLYAPTELLTDEISSSWYDRSLKLADSVKVDFHKYDAMADKFISAYGLVDVSSTLLVTMHVDAVGNCEQFENAAKNTYTSSLVIPLGEKMFDIKTTASSPAGAVRVLACKSEVNPTVFRVFAVILGVCGALQLAALLAYVYLTRNEDINYEIKVKKLVSSYRSYIQTLQNGFDTAGYQILMIKTFHEMLGIRDTIQSPILMSENADKTCTGFYIPTNSRVLYVFEIKVDDYDAIYGTSETDEALTVDGASLEEEFANT